MNTEIQMAATHAAENAAAAGWNGPWNIEVGRSGERAVIVRAGLDTAAAIREVVTLFETLDTTQTIYVTDHDYVMAYFHRYE